MLLSAGLFEVSLPCEGTARLLNRNCSGNNSSNFLFPRPNHQGSQTVTDRKTSMFCVIVRKFLTIFTRLEPATIGGELQIACKDTGFSTGGRAHSLFFSVRTKESNTSASFCANAWICSCQATDRDHERVSAVKKMNAWICALPTTDRDPASVIPEKKRKSLTTVI